jgi:hypothetical protein
MANMVKVLARAPRHSGGGSLPSTSGTRTGALRQALATGGRMGSAALAAASGVPRSVVSALLKGDIACGRVVRHQIDGGVEFELVREFDERLRQRLARARALLVRHGFTVSLDGQPGAMTTRARCPHLAADCPHLWSHPPDGGGASPRDGTANRLPSTVAPLGAAERRPGGAAAKL